MVFRGSLPRGCGLITLVLGLLCQVDHGCFAGHTVFFAMPNFGPGKPNILIVFTTYCMPPQKPLVLEEAATLGEVWDYRAAGPHIGMCRCAWMYVCWCWCVCVCVCLRLHVPLRNAPARSVVHQGTYQHVARIYMWTWQLIVHLPSKTNESLCYIVS